MYSKYTVVTVPLTSVSMHITTLLPSFYACISITEASIMARKVFPSLGLYLYLSFLDCTIKIKLHGRFTRQWRTHGRGSEPPPPIDEWKNENLSFWDDPPFFLQRLPKLLLCFSMLSNLLI